MNVLVIESASGAATDVVSALSELVAATYCVQTGMEGLRVLGNKQPQVVFLQIGAPGWETFVQRVRDDYIGVRPRLVALASRDTLNQIDRDHGFDAVALAPADREVLRATVSSSAVTLSLSRVRDLLRVGVMGRDLQRALESVALRLKLVFSTSDCQVLAVADERQWIGSAGDAPPVEAWRALWEACATAVHAGSPILSGRGTQYAIPMTESGGTVVGAIFLSNERPVLFDAESKDSLAQLGARLGAELYWWSVYKHVASERDRLSESAILDPMLGILSRAGLEPALETEIGRAARSDDPLSVAVIDVAGLRLINDRHGHVVGDAVLKQVAHAVRRSVRAQDVVGRYGGDEIAILMPGTPVPGAAKLLDRLCSAIEGEPLDVGTDAIPISVTAGISALQRDGDGDGDPDAGVAALVRAARSAANAKARGGRIVVADHADSGAQIDHDAELGPADRFEAGVILGGTYRIVHEISRGGMGVVYRAEDVGLGRPVALKMIRPDLTLDRDLVKRFRAEAAVLASLSHDNLVKVHALGEEDGDLFLVMELVEGQSLDEVITEHVEHQRWMPKARILPVVQQVAAALELMHNAQILHRDVKPANVVLDRGGGRAVLVDFGLAGRLGTTGERGGTPGFIAPETFTGGTENRCTDVYGLAATAYALLLQRAPFGSSDDIQETLTRQLEEPPETPSSLRSELGAGVDALFSRALAVNPNDRYETAAEFARVLTLAMEDPALGTTGKWRALPKMPAPSARSSKSRARPPSELDPESLPAIDAANMSRGILFRCATRALGREMLQTLRGSLEGTNAPLASALSLQTRPLAWIPTEHLCTLFSEAADRGLDSAALAHAIAGFAVSETFRRFFPSDLESLRPGPAMRAIDSLWRRYHDWGTMTADRVGDESAVISLSTTRTQLELCAFVQGMLERIVSVSGGSLPRVEHTHCERAAGGTCTFRASWSKKSVVLG